MTVHQSINPATGRVRWLDQDGLVYPQRRLEITTVLASGKKLVQEYIVEPVDGGYRLDRFDDNFDLHTYVLLTPAPGKWTCSCPDHARRPHACKHCRGLAAALKQRPY